MAVFRLNFFARHGPTISGLWGASGRSNESSTTGWGSYRIWYRISYRAAGRGAPVMLKAGQHFSLYRQPVSGNEHGVAMDSFAPSTASTANEMIFIDDGKIHLKVLCDGASDHDNGAPGRGARGWKGVNIPDVPLTFPPSARRTTTICTAMDNRPVRDPLALIASIN